MIITDVLIIGAGPAGLQAAIHSSRSKSKTIVIGKTKLSSLKWAHIENYCCMDQTHQGLDFLESGIKQAKSFGAEIIEEEILKIENIDDQFKVYTDAGKEIISKSLILATGIKRKKLGVKGEKQYLGKGVSYCVDCDANFFKGMTVAVVGDGSAAASGALLLTAYARKVYLISENLEIDGRLSSQIKASEIQLVKGKVKEIQGNEKVERIVLLDESLINISGIFIELGQKGAIELASILGVILNDQGYVMTNKEQETNILGLFAAGDVCGPPFQVPKAVGEGCVAGLNAVKYARKVK
ncbi:NAD(P)/FAD-dependent oxidoreductase [[Eubacterium] cellulosolvens]